MESKKKAVTEYQEKKEHEHFIEYDITSSGINCTLLFFDKKLEHYRRQKNGLSLKQYNQHPHIKIIHESEILLKDNFIKRWCIVDNYGIKYRVKSKLINIIKEQKQGSVNKVYNPIYLFFSNEYKQFLINNKIQLDTKLDNKFIEKYLSKLKIFSKMINNAITKWNIRKLLENVYSAIIIVDNIIVGIVYCEVLNDKEAIRRFKRKEVMLPNINIYISKVHIREDFQNKGLCRPLVSYMVRHLYRLGYKMLYILNGSSTRKGVPACICYYKAGTENNYQMNYTSKDGKFTPMSIENCYSDQMPTNYYYVYS